VIAIFDLQNQYRRLINNGLSEAIINRVNPNNSDLTASLLALLPYLLHTDPSPDKKRLLLDLAVAYPFMP